MLEEQQLQAAFLPFWVYNSFLLCI